MDLDDIKQAIVTNVYHITPDKKVPLHDHMEKDEIFYCIDGEGFGVYENREIALKVGETFVVPAGLKHSLRTEGNLYVCSFLIPAVNIESRPRD